ncbi:P27 family phage terminase small subunit [Mesorhizobium yinganensis]|uniref:P27 family phage terminase small subunit n=1 Tax=Mesorhizobium yinganensis TaxID=3157707 RepID=UPI0032B7FB1B
MTIRRPGAAEIPSAPSHLAPATRKWFDSIVSDFDLESWHLRVLIAAAEAWDRKEEARKAIAEFGLTFKDDKGGVKARPEVSIERDARIAFMRAVRELDLDTEPPAEGRRPPALRSNRG